MTATTLHVSEARAKMLTDMFASIDNKDVEALLGYLAPDATQRFANQPPLQGHDAIRAGNEAFLSSIKSLSHELVDAWEFDGTVVIRLEVSYVSLTERHTTIPVVTVFHERDGIIELYEVFFDIAPVYA